MTQFYQISQIILDRIKLHLAQEYPPELGYLIGFSYGAQVAMWCGRNCGAKIFSIDGKYIISNEIYMKKYIHTYTEF